MKSFSFKPPRVVRRLTRNGPRKQAKRTWQVSENDIFLLENELFDFGSSQSFFISNKIINNNINNNNNNYY